jgi:hypothetical protein
VAHFLARRPKPCVTSLMPRFEMHWKQTRGRPTLAPSLGLSNRQRYRNALDISKDVGSVALCLFGEQVHVYFAVFFLLCAQLHAVATI